MLGKHSDNAIEVKKLNKTLELRNREIKDIKYSLADILLQIREINESNNYHDESIRKRKISEICTDARYELLIDELEEKKTLDDRKSNLVSSK